MNSPKFGDIVTQLCASEDNPQRSGYFVKKVFRFGRANKGTWFQVTDGEGKFWETNPDTCSFISNLEFRQRHLNHPNPRKVIETNE